MVQHLTHPKIDPQTFAYKGTLLTNWGMHSVLVNLIRQMNAEFEMEMPVLLNAQEKRTSSVELDNSQVSLLVDSSVVDSQVSASNEPELVKPEMRLESKRREDAQTRADQLQEFKTKEAVDRFLEGLETMPITELKRLKDDEEYRGDTTFSMQVIMQMHKKKDAIEDKTAN